MSKRKERILLSMMIMGLLSVIGGSMAATAYTSASDYLYRVPVAVKNSSGSTYTGLACSQINASALITGSYMNTDASDYRVQQGTTFPLTSFLDSTSTSDACAWIPVKNLANGATEDFSIYMGNTTAPIDQVGVWGSASDIATVAYDSSLNQTTTLHVKASSVTVENGTATDIVKLGDSYTLGINSSGYAFAELNTYSSTTPVDQDQQDTEQTYSVSGDILGQTFTTSSAFSVTSIDIYTRYISGSGTQFYVGIYTVDGSGSPLASGLVGSRAAIEPGTSGSFSYKTASFSPGISLSASTQYAIAITNDQNGNEEHRWGYENSNVLAGGQLWWDTSPSGGTWSGSMDAGNANRDRTFRVHSVQTGSVSVVGSTNLADSVHDLEFDFSSNTLNLKVDGSSIGTATSSIGLSTVSDPLVIASRSTDGIRSIRRVEIGTSSADADNVLDLTFTADTLTKTQSGASANGNRWVYTVQDVSGSAQTASMTLVSSLTSIPSTVSPLAATASIAPRVGETTPDPWGISFNSSVADPVQNAFSKTDTYKWPMSVLQPSFSAGGLPLQLGAAVIAVVLALFMGGAALLLTRIPAMGMIAAVISAGLIVALTPLPNIILVMMAILGISVSLLIPRFWESTA